MSEDAAPRLTDEQREAYDRLSAAVEDVLRSHGEDGSLGDWVVVYAVTKLDEDGEIDQDSGHIVRDDRLADYKAEGLLRTALRDLG